MDNSDQFRDEFLSEAISEPLLLGIAAEVTKGKDGNYDRSSAVFGPFRRPRSRAMRMIHAESVCTVSYSAALQPRVNLFDKGVNRRLLAVEVTVDRQPLLTLPSANRPYASFQVGCDFLP